MKVLSIVVSLLMLGVMLIPAVSAENGTVDPFNPDNPDPVVANDNPITIKNGEVTDNGGTPSQGSNVIINLANGGSSSLSKDNTVLLPDNEAAKAIIDLVPELSLNNDVEPGGSIEISIPADALEALKDRLTPQADGTYVLQYQIYERNSAGDMVPVGSPIQIVVKVE